MSASYELKLDDQQFREAIIFMMAQLTASTISLHEELVRLDAMDKNQEPTLRIKEAFDLRQKTLTQILENLYGKYGNVDLNGLFGSKPI